MTSSDRKAFKPRLDILPAPQRALWPELEQVPAAFTLYGGTALALHLGHRESIDFDFFGRCEFTPSDLPGMMAFLDGATVSAQQRNTADLIVTRDGAPIKLSFFGMPGFPRLMPDRVCPGNRLRVASLLDVAGTKTKTVQDRAEAKDYIDIAAIIEDGRVSLSMALAAGAAIFGKGFNPQTTLKALSYFGDGNLRRLGGRERSVLLAAVKATDPSRLPSLPRPSTPAPAQARRSRDRGIDR